MATRNLISRGTIQHLSGNIKSIKIVAESAANGVIQLSEALNQSVTEIEDILNDLPVNNLITIPVSSWILDSSNTSGYPYYAEISNEKVTVNDLPIVSVSLASLSTATEAELCPICQSLNQAIRLYAKSVPSDSITIGYFIIQGQAAS